MYFLRSGGRCQLVVPLHTRATAIQFSGGAADYPPQICLYPFLERPRGNPAQYVACLLSLGNVVCEDVLDLTFRHRVHSVRNLRTPMHHPMGGGLYTPLLGPMDSRLARRDSTPARIRWNRIDVGGF